MDVILVHVCYQLAMMYRFLKRILLYCQELACLIKIGFIRFHYPRSWNTRLQSRRGYKLFRKYYGDFVEAIDMNIYLISGADPFLILDILHHNDGF